MKILKLLTTSLLSMFIMQGAYAWGGEAYSDGNKTLEKFIDKV